MARIWNSRGAAPGLATGRAHVIRHDSDFDRFSGGILVVRHATPALFTCLVRADGAVSEAGGTLSHLAVLARELGKPCVTGASGIVAALAPGAWLQVNGTAGSVKVLEEEGSAPDPAPPSPPQACADMSPVLQFGRFSGAFERTGAFFDIEVALRAAALLSVPSALGIGEDWRFLVQNGKVWVDSDMLRETCDLLVEALVNSTISSRKLRDLYLSLCEWAGWKALQAERPSEHDMAAAIARYLQLNQLTWAAAIAKEPLTQRYRSFLFNSLASLDEGGRSELFLRSLVMPQMSYIMRVHAPGPDEGMHAWSVHARGNGAPAPDAGHRSTASALARGAWERRQGAMMALAGRLSDPEFRLASFYVSAITDLVELTERKNTDLYRCGRLLFGDDARKAAVARMLGPSADSRQPVSDAGCTASLQALLTALGSSGALRSVTGLGGGIAGTRP